MSIFFPDIYGKLLVLQVRVGREGSCAQYGMVATDDIMEGETLFQIPREMLLHPATTEIKDLLNGSN